MARSAAGIAVALIGLSGALLAGVSAAMEMRALSLADSLSRYDGLAPGSARDDRLDSLVAQLDGQPDPLGGGAPAYWDTASLIYLTALSERTERDDRWRALADRAENAARRSLVQRPFHHGPWSRLAALDLVNDGELDSRGRHALTMARRSAPYRSELVLWRTEFALAIWPQLDDVLLNAALSDASFVLTGGQYDDRRRLQQALSSAPVEVQERIAARLAQAPAL